MEDRQQKLDFLAQTLSRAKQVMHKVDEKYDKKTVSQDRRPSYSEADHSSNSSQYLTEDQLREINNSRNAQQIQQYNQPGLPNGFGQQPIPQNASKPQRAYQREPTTENFDLYDDPTDRERPLPLPDINMMQQQMQQQTGQAPQYRQLKNLNTSKMPKEILESFMQRPVIDPTQPIGMEQLFQKVAQAPAYQPPPPQQQYQQPQYQQPIIAEAVSTPSSGMDMKLLEFVIQKTVEETLKQVSKQTNINENIQIKIGDQTFGGTIKTLKKVATKK